MAELASRTALGGAIGDTFAGMVVCGVRADGDYVWRPAVLMAGTRASDADIAAGIAARYVDAEHLKTALDALNISGEMVGVSATYAGLPAIPSDASADVSYHAWMNADEIGTGDTANPQYPQGLYIPDGTFTNWVLAWRGSAPEVKDAAPTALSTNAVESQGILAALDAKEDNLPIDTALRFLRRNAANDDWELADIPITAQNLVSGPGTPGAAVGNDGDYYVELDAATGTNNVWGPKAAGAWPAQADFRSADPNEGTIAEENAGTVTDPRSWAPATLANIRLGHENFTTLSDGGTAEIGTGRLIAPGVTIAAPTTRPNGQAAQEGDYFQLALNADGSATITGVAETATFTGLQASSHAWVFVGGQWVDLDPQIDEALTQAEIESTTGLDYTEFGTISAERLDQWGLTRRVQRIFDATATFDYTTLNYVDRTAVYVRNANNASGIGYKYRTDNTVSLELRQADGVLVSDTPGVNEFNVQPGEIVFGEKDGNVFRASIIPAERVKNSNDALTANSLGPLPHDSIVTTRDGLIGWRKTGFNNRSFPADGQSDADWFVFDLGTGDQADAWVASTAYVTGDVRSAAEPDAADADFGTVFNWYRLADGTSGAVFDVTEKANWQRMSVVQDPDVWQTQDSTTDALMLGTYGTKQRVIGDGTASTSIAFPTPGGTNLGRDFWVANDSSVAITVGMGSTTTRELGATADDASTNVVIQPSERLIGISSSATETRYRIVGGSESDTSLTAPLETLYPINAAESGGLALTATEDYVPEFGIRMAQTAFTALAQNYTHEITQDGDIEIAIHKSDHTGTAFTIMVRETGTGNQFSQNLATNGALSQPIGDPTNELTGLSMAATDWGDYWLVKISGSRPTNVDLRMWGNDIGDATDFTNYRYAFRLVDSSVNINTTSFVRRENVASAAGSWVDIGGGLEIRAGGDNNVANYPRLRVNDNIPKLIKSDTFYQSNATVEPTGREVRTEYLADGEEWNVRENTGYNLQANYIQHCIFTDTYSGRQWIVNYTVQADDASIVLNSTYQAGNIYSVPETTVVATPRTITLSGGLATIGGLASATVLEGVSTSLKLDLNTGQQIAIATIDSGAVSVTDPINGWVVVTAGAADAAITIAESPAATYQGVQVVAEATNAFPISAAQNGDHVIQFASSLANVDYYEIDFSDQSGNHGTVAKMAVPVRNVSSGSLAQWFDTTYVRGRQSDAEFAANQLILTPINFSTTINIVRAMAYAENGFVVPTATVSKSQITLQVNGGLNVVAPTQILEGAGAVGLIVDVPTGQQIDTVAFEAQTLPAGVTAVVRDSIAGNIAIEVAEGTGNVDLTVPFVVSASPWTTTTVNVQGGGAFVEPTGGVQEIRWKVVSGILFGFVKIDWTASTGGNGGTGQHSIDLTQLGVAPDFTDIELTSSGYGAMPLGNMQYHDPSAVFQKGIVMRADAANSITFGFDDAASQIQDWGSDYGSVAARAEYYGEFRVPVA